MDLKERRDRYRETVKEWNDRRKEAMREWKKRMKEWKVRAKLNIAKGSLPPLPPLPPLPSIEGYALPEVRSNVVASRIGDEELRVVDMLIEAGLFSTRSEAVAYLLSEGIKARRDVLEKVSSALEDIRRIRKEAEEYVAKLKREIGLVKPEAAGEPLQHEKTCPQCSKDLTNLPNDIVICPYCGFSLRKN